MSAPAQAEKSVSVLQVAACSVHLSHNDSCSAGSSNTDKKQQQEVTTLRTKAKMGGNSVTASVPQEPSSSLEYLDKVPSSLPPCRQRVYSFRDLDTLNLFETAAWVFDIREKRMLWASEEGVALWSANSLEELLARDFVSDMSKASERVMLAHLERFYRGDSERMTWTFHPNYGKDGPKTCELIATGIYVWKEGEPKMPNFVHLVRVIKIIAQGSNDSRTQEERMALRRHEMIKHFPIIARQFSVNGQLMDQNPEALAVFGAPSDALSSEMFLSGSAGPLKRKDSTSNDIKSKESPNHFLAQFVDLDEGRQVWEEIQQGHDSSKEALQYTIHGQSWFSIDVRRIQDPDTSEKTILFSARDISKLMKYAQAQAEERNKARTEFFAVMAHEIRTPLHQVLGSIELLERSNETKYPLSEEQKECIQILRTSSTAMMAIINDSLDFSKLEAGKFVLENIQFKIRGVIEGCVAAVQPQAENNNLKIVTEIEDIIPEYVICDPNRLRQILLNLLSNAVKFSSKQGGTIEMKVQQRQTLDDVIDSDKKNRNSTALFVSVRDPGVGLSKPQQCIIFDAYKQAEPSVARNYGGTGLGLTICRKLAILMGGEIGVESELGRGSTFWFQVPFFECAECKERHDDVGSLSPPPRKEKDDKEKDDQNEQVNHCTYQVLVVEDNKVNIKIISKMLQKLGHTVTVAENGKLAVDAIEERYRSTNDGTQDLNGSGGFPKVGFDIVLMDWQMPVMDGIEATKEIRRLGHSKAELPVIGLTASIQNRDWLDSGMNECLKKPLRINELVNALSRNLSETGRTTNVIPEQ